MDKRLPEAEEILRRTGEYHGPNEGRRLVRSASWFALVVLTIGAAIYIAGRFLDKPQPPPNAVAPRVAELKVVGSKVIGPNEELRVVWMPDEFNVLGHRCLLYTNSQTGASALSCPGGSSVAPEDDQ